MNLRPKSLQEKSIQIGFSKIVMGVGYLTMKHLSENASVSFLGYLEISELMDELENYYFPERYTPGWIPFPDSYQGLPKVGTLYDVTRKNDEGAVYTDQLTFHNVPAWLIANVIAYRLAPEPYMGDDKEQS